MYRIELATLEIELAKQLEVEERPCQRPPIEIAAASKNEPTVQARSH
jgi:hypothetical protein